VCRIDKTSVGQNVNGRIAKEPNRFEPHNEVNSL